MVDKCRGNFTGVRPSTRQDRTRRWCAGGKNDDDDRPGDDDGGTNDGDDDGDDDDGDESHGSRARRRRERKRPGAATRGYFSLLTGETMIGRGLGSIRGQQSVRKLVIDE